MNTLNTQQSDAPLFLASRGKRILSTAFDAVLTAAAVMFVTLASGQFEGAEPYLNDTIALRVSVIISLTYCALQGYTLWRSSQTLGKALFGLQVVSYQTDLTTGDATATPSRAQLPQLAVRAGALLALVFIPVIGIWLQAVHLLDVAMLFTASRRTLHDRIARTTVTSKLTRHNTGTNR